MLKRVLIPTRSTSLGSLPLGHKDLAINIEDGAIVVFQIQMCSVAECGHDCFLLFYVATGIS